MPQTQSLSKNRKFRKRLLHFAWIALNFERGLHFDRTLLQEQNSSKKLHAILFCSCKGLGFEAFAPRRFSSPEFCSIIGKPEHWASSESPPHALVAKQYAPSLLALWRVAFADLVVLHHTPCGANVTKAQIVNAF